MSGTRGTRLISWLYQYKPRVNVEENPLLRTHNLMSGGKLSIPDDRIDEFHRLYAQDIDSGNRTWTFSEIRSDPAFRMYFDLDMYAVDVPDDGHRVALVIQSTVKQYYPESTDADAFLMVSCTTEPSKTTKDGRTLVKSGMHIVFPNLIVDYDEALQLRHAAVYNLQSELGKREVDGNPWSDALDKIYRKGCGLRMIGSVKMIPCAECNGSKVSDRSESDRCKALRKSIADKRLKFFKLFPEDFENVDVNDFSTLSKAERNDPSLHDAMQQYLDVSVGTCVSCFGKGRVHDTRTYAVSNVSDGVRERPELLESLCQSTYDALTLTSIRVPSDASVTAGYKVPANAPMAPTDETSTKFLVVAPKFRDDLSLLSECASADMFKTDADGLAKWKAQGQDVSSANSMAEVQRVIRKQAPYCDIVVQNLYCLLISQDKKKSAPDTVDGFIKRVVARVSGVGSTFCQNKGGCHNSNSIYFMFGPTWFYQKCFSRKSLIRAGGRSCTSYAGPGIRVSDELRAMLFPEIPPEVCEVTVGTSALSASREKHPSSEAFAETVAKRHCVELDKNALTPSQRAKLNKSQKMKGLLRK